MIGSIYETCSYFCQVPLSVTRGCSTDSRIQRAAAASSFIFASVLASAPSLSLRLVRVVRGPVDRCADEGHPPRQR